MQTNDGKPLLEEHANVPPEPDDSGNSMVRRWASRWDTGLLVLLVVAFAGMILYLLYPQPQASISLRTMPLSAVPHLPEDAPASSLSASANSGRPSNTRKTRRFQSKKKPEKPPVLNLNTATVEQLQLLPGIGPKMAERIVEYRKAQGPFINPEQIMDVKGIGSKKFEKLRVFLKVS